MVERRIELMERSGIEFSCGVDATGCAERICGESAAVVLACGARTARRVDVPGADLAGVEFALDYLSEATRALLDERSARINAADKDVVVIGGGDTGVDCVATALRQGARSVRQVIRAAEPPVSVDSAAVWPAPRGERTTGYGQREAAVVFGSDPRIWSTDTVGFADDGAGHVRGVVVESRSHGSERAHSEVPAQLVLIAKGFTGAERSVLDAFEGFGNVHIAGDARMGASLVASAIADGLQVAGKLASELFG